MLDSFNIKDLNTRWLRAQIGYVGQEPVLFSGSIAENIAYGLDVTFAPELAVLESADSTSEAVSKAKNTLRDRVIEAAIQANAHDFITSLPEGYETDVGSSGSSMSGGQKQRIAIARALIKKPVVLLLDEATSALDATSERIVQESIDKLQQAKSQTTIIIAHRLSTIRTADKIAVVNQGVIAEEGTHESLMAKNGLYADLVKLQLDTDDKDEGDGSDREAAESEVDSEAKSQLESYKASDSAFPITNPQDLAAITDNNSNTYDIEAGHSTTPHHKKAESPRKLKDEGEADLVKDPTVDLDKEIKSKIMGRIWNMVWEHATWFLVAILGSTMYVVIHPPIYLDRHIYEWFKRSIPIFICPHLMSYISSQGRSYVPIVGVYPGKITGRALLF